MNMYRFTWMGHDQCVATTLREHNDLKDSAKAYTQQIYCRSTSGKLCRLTRNRAAHKAPCYRERGLHTRRPRLKDGTRAHTQQIYCRSTSGKLCMSTPGKTADPLKETLLSRETLQIHSGKLCRSTQGTGGRAKTGHASP